MSQHVGSNDRRKMRARDDLINAALILADAYVKYGKEYDGELDGLVDAVEAYRASVDRT